MRVVGTAPDGTDIRQLRLRSGEVSADILSFGATLQDLRLRSHPGSLVLGYRDPLRYLTNPSYFGATVGRYANRIRDGHATIDGAPVQLDQNTEHGHMLHGGRQGCSHMNWQVVDQSETAATLAITLPDGHMGFPGTLQAHVIYRLRDTLQLDIDISARTDAPTLCSFAHHSYFNLGTQPTIDDHWLELQAERYLPVDETGIPTGRIAEVQGTRFDFGRPRRLGDDLILDHSYCLPGGEVAPVARLSCDRLALEIASTAPGLQVYTGDGIGPGDPCPGYGPRSGIALEPQLWPDAPNHTGFPSALLKPGQAYEQKTRLRLFAGG